MINVVSSTPHVHCYRWPKLDRLNAMSNIMFDRDRLMNFWNLDGTTQSPALVCPHPVRIIELECQTPASAKV